MKSAPNLLIAISSTLLSLVFIAQAFTAQAATVDANEKLTGSDLLLKDAVKTSDAIFRGQLIEIGAPVFKGIGESFYGVKVNVIETYLGNLDAYESSIDNVLVSLLVLPHPGNERSPVVDHLYIFFVQKTKSPGLNVLKILPATDNNIAMVDKLIASGPDQVIPPVAQLNEIDVDYDHPGVLYFIRIRTKGSATLAFASQGLGYCPPKTFNFEDLYKELSALPEVPLNKSPYEWKASFRWRNGQTRDPMERPIEDPKIVLRILEKFVNGSMGKNQYLLKRLSEYPALPPAENAALKGY